MLAAMSLQYVKAEPVTLKLHPDYNEAWLQDVIAKDPTVLGLWDIEVVARERRQDKAGRLDMLLYDRDENTRYEVELMLGATDESHIIRCLEYWDIERRRFPAYDHCAVIVAENITSRFLNILSLFAGTIPLVAIQLSALKVGGQLVLNFVTVLDRVALRQDDESETTSPAVDRDAWVTWASAATVGVADRIVARINNKATRKRQLSYVQSYIGLSDGGKRDNFISFVPQKAKTVVYARVNDAQKSSAQLQEQGVDATYDKAWRMVRINVRPDDLAGEFPDWLDKLIAEAVQLNEQD
jgi:hypothetical protein